MNRHRNILTWLALLLAWFPGIARVSGQTSLVPENTGGLAAAVFTLGSVTRDAAGHDWAYLVFQPTDDALMAGKQLAIYAKPGDADSTSPLAKKSVVLATGDPAAIGPMLDRAHQLGDDLDLLKMRLSVAFTNPAPAPLASLADRLSLAIRSAATNPPQASILALLGRVHPAVNLVFGRGYAQLISPGKTTFEVRELDPVSQQELRVLGRVTVEAGKPVVLAAPSAPVQVPETTARGNLNAQLRWATPVELRRLSLLVHGYNLWRVPRVAAIAAGFDTTPPSFAQLTSNPATVRVNDLPIVPGRQYFSDAEALNFAADPNTVFVDDDNHWKQADQPGFKNGDTFYYFATARDLLGRDGLVSQGTEVILCDRLPPPAPAYLHVDNEFSKASDKLQRLRLTWPRSSLPAAGGNSISGYRVYRWADPGEMSARARNPTNNLVAEIDASPASSTYTYLDSGPGAPSGLLNPNQTFWYSVRAVDAGACGPNLSPNGPVAFGVIRDFTAPRPPSGTVTGTCCPPQIFTEGQTNVPISNLPLYTDLTRYLLVCHRSNVHIAWAEFFAASSLGTNSLGRYWFLSAGDNVYSPVLPIPTVLTLDRAFGFFCQVGTDTGLVTTNAFLHGGAVDSQSVGTLGFRATVDCQTGGDCSVHVAQVAPGGTNSPICISISLMTGTREYRLYRRVDDGPLTLIKQGEADFDSVKQIVVADQEMPASSSVVCYFGQLLDEHGNASPLAQLGDCITVAKAPPQPMLAPLEPFTSGGQPHLRIRWFCPTAGVDRFRVWLSDDANKAPNVLVAELGANENPASSTAAVNIDGQSQTLKFDTYLTPQPGPMFGDGAEFKITPVMPANHTWTVFVTAVGKGGLQSPPSNVGRVTWNSAAADTGPSVPWPARPLPPSQKSSIFEGFLIASQLPTNVFDGIGIQVGIVPTDFQVQVDYKPNDTIDIKTSLPNVLLGSAKLDDIFLRDLSLVPLNNFVVYRIQSPSATFPTISGDLVQVTPLVSRLRSKPSTLPALTENIKYINASVGDPVTQVVDPFLKIVYLSTLGPASLVVLDTQPVIQDAAYTYLIVRLDDRGEIRDVIPAGPVEVK